MTPAFDVLLILAVAIPVAMLIHYRAIPILRRRDPVPWPYALPFVTMAVALTGVAVAVYLNPFAFVGTPAEQALGIVIAVEFGAVVVTTELLTRATDADNDAHPLP